MNKKDNMHKKEALENRQTNIDNYRVKIQSIFDKDSVYIHPIIFKYRMLNILRLNIGVFVLIAYA